MHSNSSKAPKRLQIEAKMIFAAFFHCIFIALQTHFTPTDEKQKTGSPFFHLNKLSRDAKSVLDCMKCIESLYFVAQNLYLKSSNKPQPSNNPPPLNKPPSKIFLRNKQNLRITPPPLE